MTCRAEVCGNGRVDADEACDDGNAVETDGCTSACVAAVCGDGIVRLGLAEGEPGFERLRRRQSGRRRWLLADLSARGLRNGRADAGEACDDGNQDLTDACLSDCTLARCGDGVVRRDLAEDQPGFEFCDDANGLQTDACLNNCTLARCGDGHVQAGVEGCDDGNEVDTDGCRNDCTVQRCGDGVIAEGIEACDDGNRDNTDVLKQLRDRPLRRRRGARRPR